MVNESATEKPAPSLTPPTAHMPLCDVKDDRATPDSTFIVDINPHASEESDLSERHSGPSSSLSERPLLSPCPDVCSTNSSVVKSDEDGDTPIEPPGLQKSSADPVDCPAIEALPATETSPPEVTSTDTAVSSLLHDALLDIEPSVFEHDLSRFSLTGVSPLDTFIPPELFPEDILVHDLDNITKCCPRNERGLNVPKRKKHNLTDVPVRYVRVYPEPSSPLMANPDAEKEKGEVLGAQTSASRVPPRRIAHLYLRRANSLGTGNHSCVYRAPLRLRLDPNSSVEGKDQDGEEVKGWRTVSVAAKTADAVCGAHQMLDREARAYDAFPPVFMQDRMQLRSAPSHEPSLTHSKDLGDTSRVGSTPYEASLGIPLPYMHCNVEVVLESVQLPALVPKFFGYYCPADSNGKRIGRYYHKWCYTEDTCPVKWPKHLLLVEECGQAVTPRTLPREHRYVFVGSTLDGFEVDVHI